MCEHGMGLHLVLQPVRNGFFCRPNRHLWRSVQSQIVELQAVDIKLFIRLAYQWRLGVH